MLCNIKRNTIFDYEVAFTFYNVALTELNFANAIR